MKNLGGPKSSLGYALTALMVLTLLPTVAPAQAPPPADLKAQLSLLLSWWSGHYDNHEQIVRQSGGGLSRPVLAPVHRLHSHYQRVSLPALGDNVLYLEEYRDNDPANIARIRFYRLSIDETQRAIRVKLYAPLDSNALRGAWREPERLTKITLEQLRAFRDQCDVLLHFVGNQFSGGMQPRACDVEKREWFEYQLAIGPNFHWVRDRRRHLRDDRVTWEMAPGSNYAWFEQTKARWFRCEVNHSANGDMTQTKPLTKIELHDQGGEADIAWPDGRTLTFTIHTRAFTSPSERVFPLFRIHEKGQTVPIAYAYAVDDAERFGINLGWFYTLCYAQR
jgi:hypothetical protein